MSLFLLTTIVLAVDTATALELTMFQTNDGTVLDGQFGFAVVTVGDMDGDGFSEYAVGASFDSLPGPAAGRVFIYRGGSLHFGDPPAWTIDGLTADLLGRSLAPAGDQDGDGYADLLIGAPGATTVNPIIKGRALLAYGSSPLGTRPPLMIIGTSERERFATSVACSDLDGDGDRDLVVGAPGFNNDAGAVHVFRSEPAGPVPWFTLHGRAIGDEFGAAVADLGSTRGGALGTYSDILIGAPFHSDEIFFWNGEAYLYFGGAAPDTVCDMTWQGNNDGDFFGDALAGAGDVDGDGQADWLIGSPGANVFPDIDVGRFDLFLGSSVPPMHPAVTGFGTVQFSDYGLGLAGIGDIDNDKFCDWAVGMPGSPDAMIPGEAHVFRGGTLLSAIPDTILLGEVIDDQFGRTISNGDSVLGGEFDLFLVGSYLHGGAGRTYLYGTGGGRVDVPHGDQGKPAWVQFAKPWPNPGAERVRLAFTLERAAPVRLEIFDLGGRAVATLADQGMEPGRHEFRWPGRGIDAPAGTYWALLTTGGARLARRFVVLGN